MGSDETCSTHVFVKSLCKVSCNLKILELPSYFHETYWLHCCHASSAFTYSTLLSIAQVLCVVCNRLCSLVVTPESSVIYGKG